MPSVLEPWASHGDVVSGALALGLDQHHRILNLATNGLEGLQDLQPFAVRGNSHVKIALWVWCLVCFLTYTCEQELSWLQEQRRLGNTTLAETRRVNKVRSAAAASDVSPSMNTSKYCNVGKLKYCRARRFMKATASCARMGALSWLKAPHAQAAISMHHRWKIKTGRISNGWQENLPDTREELCYTGKIADAANMIQILVEVNTRGLNLLTATLTPDDF